MSTLEIFGLVFAAIAGGVSAYLMRVYKMGPYLDEDPTIPPEPHNPPLDPAIPDPLEGPKQPQDTTSAPEPLPVPTSAPRATLENFCLAIKAMEGANPANNNPGNCRYFYGGYHPMYEPVGISKGGFAVFPTYALGWTYLKNTVKTKIKNHPNWTLVQFFENYAPKSDGNDPVGYASFVAKKLSVDNAFKVKNIVLT